MIGITVKCLQIGASEDGSESGLLNDELEAAVATLHSLADNLGCSCVRLRERKELRGVVVQYLIRRVLDQAGEYFDVIPIKGFVISISAYWVSI